MGMKSKLASPLASMAAMCCSNGPAWRCSTGTAGIKGASRKHTRRTRQHEVVRDVQQARAGSPDEPGPVVESHFHRRDEGRQQVHVQQHARLPRQQEERPQPHNNALRSGLKVTAVLVEPNKSGCLGDTDALPHPLERHGRAPQQRVSAADQTPREPEQCVAKQQAVHVVEALW